MSLSCRLFGHNYQEVGKETEEDENVVIESKVSECTRCGDEKSREVRTEIRQGSEETESPQTSENVEHTTNQEQDDNEYEYLNPDETPTSRQDSGVILDEETTDNGTKSNETTSNTAQTRQRPDVDQNGGIILKENKDTQTISQVVVCSECDYRKRFSETPRRSGDICKECGGWLETEN